MGGAVHPHPHTRARSLADNGSSGQPQADYTTQSGAYFNRIPNPKPGGPTHMINGGSAGPMLLGRYDSKAEKLMLDERYPPQVLDSGHAYRWGAVGWTDDGSRLLIVAWVAETGTECDHGWGKGFGGCARSVASLVRELVFDHAVDQLVSRPVAEYALLHNATFVDGEIFLLPAGGAKTLPVPAALGGAIDLTVSFSVAELSETTSGFGVSVRAPPSASTPGGVDFMFDVSAPDAAGTRIAHLYQGALPPKPTPILPYMNNTDLSGGDYHSQHLPPDTDPRVCGALCLKDPSCMVWVYVVRGHPAGSGDCIFKNEKHGCPVSSPVSPNQGLCVAGRGHEPANHACGGGKPPPDDVPRFQVLKGETLDLRLLVDRPVVSAFAMNGRVALTHAAADFDIGSTAVHLRGSPERPITVANVSVHGMACGWTDSMPVPGGP